MLQRIERTKERLGGSGSRSWVLASIMAETGWVDSPKCSKGSKMQDPAIEEIVDLVADHAALLVSVDAGL